tara:strand:- start:224 stop:466 length:243 start_codon:yes stop_codon:yes gene_type:complete
MIHFKYYRDKNGKYYFIPITIRFKKEIEILQKRLDSYYNKKRLDSILLDELEFIMKYQHIKQYREYLIYKSSYLLTYKKD